MLSHGSNGVKKDYRSRREHYRIRPTAVRNLTAVAVGTGIVVQSIPWARFRSAPLNGRRPGLGRSSHLRFVVSGCEARSSKQSDALMPASTGAPPQYTRFSRVPLA